MQHTDNKLYAAFNLESVSEMTLKLLLTTAPAVKESLNDIRTCFCRYFPLQNIIAGSRAETPLFRNSGTDSVLAVSKPSVGTETTIENTFSPLSLYCFARRRTL